MNNLLGALTSRFSIRNQIFFSILLMLIFGLFVQKHLVKGMTMGAVK
ncbi:hypothetical protein ACE41H_17835 [Paenibacillus enshidis]|uniref:ABC transporter permease n=1 Tax=Paenibacillus enshidis TaxID=1458439 RepID=A0ABV5AWP2_9BACL